MRIVADDVKYATSRLTIVNDVVIGRDGHLFIAYGSNRNLEYVCHISQYTESALRGWHNGWVIAQRECYSRGIGYSAVVFPNKESICWSAHPMSDTIDRPQSPGRMLKSIDTAGLVHFYSPSDPTLFYKSDSHFSPKGVLRWLHWFGGLIDERIAKLTLDELAALIPLRDFTMNGDLGIKLSPPITEPGKIVARHRDNIIIGNGVNNRGFIEVNINPNAKINKRVLLLGDSFFRQSRFHYGCLFRSVVMVHTTFFCTDLLNIYKPHAVLQGNVERFLNAAPETTLAPCSFDDLPLYYGKERPTTDLRRTLAAEADID